MLLTDIQIRKAKAYALTVYHCTNLIFHSQFINKRSAIISEIYLSLTKFSHNSI